MSDAAVLPRPRRSIRKLLIYTLGIAVIVAVVVSAMTPFSVGYNSITQTTRYGGCIEFGGTPADNGLKYSDVSIPARWGGAYRGFFVPGTLDATILIPPTGSGGRTSTLREVGILAKHGYAVLTWEARSCVGKPISLGYREVDDVEDAYAYLQRNSDHLQVSLNHAGLDGFSTAGATVEMAAGRNPQFGAVVALGNYADLGDMATSTVPHNLTEAMLGLGVRLGYWVSTREDPANLNPTAAMPKIAPRPILLIYGTLETTYAPQQLVNAYRAADPNGGIQLWMVPNAGHGGYIDAVGEATYASHVLPFLDCALLKQCGSGQS
jgi:uncharacterized protein